MNYVDVTINGINIFKKYKAPLAELHSVQPPTPKTFFQDVPGADGALDLSIVISDRPTYERRQITMNFNCEQRENQWPSTLSEILREFHGKEGKIIFSDDAGYYYIGRMAVSNYERSSKIGKFAITVNAEPYKNELLSSMEPWLWGPFNFRTGVIRSYGNITVNGRKTLNIQGTERWIVPEFIVTGSIHITFEGKMYSLKQGKSKIYEITIKPGINALMFEGNGAVSINYRGGIL